VTLSPSSTYQEIWEPDCYKSGGWELGGRQLGWRRTLYLRQPGPCVTVPRYGYNRWPTSSCTFLNPLGDQAVHRPGHLLGCGGEDDLGVSTIYIFKFYLVSYFVVLLAGAEAADKVQSGAWHLSDQGATILREGQLARQRFGGLGRDVRVVGIHGVQSHLRAKPT
jgi:hypothetical protein